MSLHAVTKLTHKTHSYRFIELDILRGSAIAIMIFFHTLWDLNYFGLIQIDTSVYQYNKIFSPIFFLLVGICLAISINKRQTKSELTKHLLIRGLWVFGLGMILTAITLLFVPDKPIFFGVLHCIGLSIILSTLFLRFKTYNIIFATAIILAGIIIESYPIKNPTVFHLAIGLHQSGVWRYTIDYFPLFPWFGVCLFGIAIGNLLYKDNKRRFIIPDISKYKPAKMFSWLGQHSLAIYLLHQPIIAGALSLFVIL